MSKPGSPVGAGQDTPKGVADHEQKKAHRKEDQSNMAESKEANKAAVKTLANADATQTKADTKQAADQWRRDRAADQAQLKKQRETDAELKRGARLEQLEIKNAQAKAKAELERVELAYAVCMWCVSILTFTRIGPARNGFALTSSVRPFFCRGNKLTLRTS